MSGWPARYRAIARVAATVLFVASLAPAGAHARPADGGWVDPTPEILRRMDRYLQLYQVDGVTMDWRYSVSPSEEIRQTVVCQLLGYVELYRLDPRPRLRHEIEHHADFMIGRLADIRSHSPFDGMLAYALLEAYEVTNEARFYVAAADVEDEMLAIPTYQCVLNGGLMVALGTGEDWFLTGNPEARQKTIDILAQLAPYQNADGSFPHWCWGSRDIHYTGWMATELVHIRRHVPDPSIPGYLSRMNAFLDGRVGNDGRSTYEEPCPGVPGCTNYYYSRASGCGIDYDTRGWTVEPAYCALLFDVQGSAKFAPVMSFFSTLEHDGFVADQYGWWPPPDDPEYPWTIADTSAVNTSVDFWVFATLIAERVARGVPVQLVLDDLVDGVGPPPPVVPRDAALAASPNPFRASCSLAFSLARPAPVRLDVIDLAGRRVRTLADGPLGPGPHAFAWDGRDARGGRVGEGVYFARLERDGRRETSRLVRVP